MKQNDNGQSAAKPELWAIIDENNNYEVSTYGRVRRISTGKILKGGNHKRYITVALHSNGIRSDRYVHRLVAQAFIPNDNPEEKKYVNHLDHNIQNNYVENLEWCTPSENIMHGWKNGLYNEDTRKKMSLKASSRVGNKNNCWRGYVKISDLEGNVLNVSETLKDAQEWVRSNTIYKQADKGNISLVCNGKLKKMYGLLFEYVKEI